MTPTRNTGDQPPGTGARLCGGFRAVAATAQVTKDDARKLASSALRACAPRDEVCSAGGTHGQEGACAPTAGEGRTLSVCGAPHSTTEGRAPCRGRGARTRRSAPPVATDAQCGPRGRPASHPAGRTDRRGPASRPPRLLVGREVLPGAATGPHNPTAQRGPKPRGAGARTHAVSPTCTAALLTTARR